MALLSGAKLPTNVRQAMEQTADDGVPFRARTAYMYSTWAKTYSSFPELLIQPQSQAEVEKLVQLAKRCRRRVVTVGSGHSPSDLTCTASWLVNLDKFNKMLSIDRVTGLVVMEAGIRVSRLGAELDRFGLAMPNLGSIDEQSIAGVISTGTHGSTLRHGLLSESIMAMKLVLGDGKTHSCSATERPELFRAALLSLGALGIIIEVTLCAVPAFALSWEQSIDSDQRLFQQWERGLWTQSDFVRVWWFPYMRRAAVWKAEKACQSELESGAVRLRDPPRNMYDTWLGYVIYHNLLYLSRWVPRILPLVERFVFGMQHGFRNGPSTQQRGVQASRKALLNNCLYSQFVNEWAVPLEKGPEALCRLGSWLGKLRPGDAGYVEHGIPFSAEGLWVHSPVEVRVANTSVKTRPWLDPSCKDHPTLYLNALMYRPYHLDPPWRATERYYEGFEWLMRDLGGKPHWAKNFNASAADVESWYGDDLVQWRKVRDAADPEGIFIGPWHRRLVLPRRHGQSNRLECEEVDYQEKPAKHGGVLWLGKTV